jgi:hypothetical protein
MATTPDTNITKARGFLKCMNVAVFVSHQNYQRRGTKLVPRTMRLVFSSHFPSSFSTVTTYAPASLRTTLAIVIEVMHVIVSVLKRFGSGKLPPLNVHVTFGLGLAANGTSIAVEEPTGNVNVRSVASLNRGGTARIKVTRSN